MHPCPIVSKLTGGEVQFSESFICTLGFKHLKVPPEALALSRSDNPSPCIGTLRASAAVNAEQLHPGTELCWVPPLGQSTVTRSLDAEVSGNGKKQWTALERKGLTCASTCGWSELWLGGSINHFALATYSLRCATLIFSLRPKAVYSYWLSQQPEDSSRVSSMCSFCH